MQFKIFVIYKAAASRKAVTFYKVIVLSEIYKNGL